MGKLYLNEEEYGGGGGGVDYSTTEQDTGKKWIDGRPVYSKTYYVASIAVGGSNYVELDANFKPSVYDVSFCTMVKWDYTSSGQKITVQSNRGANASNGFIMLNASENGGLRMYNLNSGFTATDVYTTIEYTKVADLPQS